MSPIENGRVLRDKDSFWRDERGLLSMPHLTASIASFLGIGLCISGFVMLILFTSEGIELVRFGAGLVTAGAGLEGWQTHVESKNQKVYQEHMK